MLKKIGMLSLAVMLVFGLLVGCGGEDKEIVIEEPTVTTFKITTKANWGEGIDFIHSVIDFKEGDVVYVKGNIHTANGTSLVINTRPGAENNLMPTIGGGEGPFEGEATITDTHMGHFAEVQAHGSPSGIRVQLKGGSTGGATGDVWSLEEFSVTRAGATVFSLQEMYLEDALPVVIESDSVFANTFPEELGMKLAGNPKVEVIGPTIPVLAGSFSFSGAIGSVYYVGETITATYNRATTDPAFQDDEGEDNYTYAWSGAGTGTGLSITPAVPGTYTITATADGKVARGNVTVVAVRAAFGTITVPATGLKDIALTGVTHTGTNAAIAYTYQWMKETGTTAKAWENAIGTGNAALTGFAPEAAGKFRLRVTASAFPGIMGESFFSNVIDVFEPIPGTMELSNSTSTLLGGTLTATYTNATYSTEGDITFVWYKDGVVITTGPTAATHGGSGFWTSTFATVDNKASAGEYHVEAVLIPSKAGTMVPLPSNKIALTVIPLVLADFTSANTSSNAVHVSGNEWKIGQDGDGDPANYGELRFNIGQDASEKFTTVTIVLVTDIQIRFSLCAAVDGGDRIDTGFDWGGWKDINPAETITNPVTVTLNLPSGSSIRSFIFGNKEDGTATVNITSVTFN